MHSARRRHGKPGQTPVARSCDVPSKDICRVVDGVGLYVRTVGQGESHRVRSPTPGHNPLVGPIASVDGLASPRSVPTSKSIRYEADPTRTASAIRLNEHCAIRRVRRDELGVRPRWKRSDQQTGGDEGKSKQRSEGHRGDSSSAVELTGTG